MENTELTAKEEDDKVMDFFCKLLKQASYIIEAVDGIAAIRKSEPTSLSMVKYYGLEFQKQLEKVVDNAYATKEIVDAMDEEMLLGHSIKDLPMNEKLYLSAIIKAIINKDYEFHDDGRIKIKGLDDIYQAILETKGDYFALGQRITNLYRQKTLEDVRKRDQEEDSDNS